MFGSSWNLNNTEQIKPELVRSLNCLQVTLYPNAFSPCRMIFLVSGGLSSLTVCFKPWDENDNYMGLCSALEGKGHHHAQESLSCHFEIHLTTPFVPY